MTDGDLPRMIRAGEVGRLVRGGQARTLQQVLAEGAARMDEQDRDANPYLMISLPARPGLLARLAARLRRRSLAHGLIVRGRAHGAPP